MGTKTFQGDFTFWDSDLSRAEIVAKMRTLKPIYPFRQNYGYCNAGFLAAGEVIPAVLGGKKWEDWVQQRLLTPLGMTNTYPLTADYAQRPNIARPYSNAFGPLVALPFDHIDNLAPAAGPSLVRQRPGALAAVPTRQWALRGAASAALGHAAPHPPAQYRRIVFKINRYTQPFFHVRPGHFCRRLQWPASVLAHRRGQRFRDQRVLRGPRKAWAWPCSPTRTTRIFFEALRYQLLDAYLGVPYVDRSRQLYALARAGREETRHSVSDMVARVQRKERLAHRLRTYVGTYQNPVYGAITVEAQGRQAAGAFFAPPQLGGDPRLHERRTISHYLFQPRLRHLPGPVRGRSRRREKRWSCG